MRTTTQYGLIEWIFSVNDNFRKQNFIFDYKNQKIIILKNQEFTNLVFFNDFLKYENKQVFKYNNKKYTFDFYIPKKGQLVQDFLIDFPNQNFAYTITKDKNILLENLVERIIINIQKEKNFINTKIFDTDNLKECFIKSIEWNQKWIEKEKEDKKTLLLFEYISEDKNHTIHFLVNNKDNSIIMPNNYKIEFNNETEYQTIELNNSLIKFKPTKTTNKQANNPLKQISKYLDITYPKIDYWDIVFKQYHLKDIKLAQQDLIKKIKQQPTKSNILKS